jgi:hypothetical protein
MRKQVAAVAVAAAFALVGCASGPLGSKSPPPTSNNQMEAVAIVTAIDPVKRTVRVETPKGQTVVAVPPETNLGAIQVGNRYRVRYSEPVAVAIEPSGPAAAGGATAAVQPSSPTTGEGVKRDRVSGTIEQIDGRQIVLRTADGGRQAFRTGSGVLRASAKQGDTVTLTYQQAVATQMASTPQPVSDPAPAQ